MPRAYSWYAKVRPRNPLVQGDLIRDCPILLPPADIDQTAAGDNIRPNINKYDVVVLSQSCDLENNKIDMVLVCPYITLTEMGTQDSNYSSADTKNRLLEGNVVGYHLLNKCNIRNFEHDFLIVDFRNTFSVPIEIIRVIASRRDARLRLLPPYREQLAQAFARFFMRVGLPIDIPRFE